MILSVPTFVAGAASGTTSSSDYLDGWTIAVLALGMVSAGVCVLAGAHGRAPGRVTLGLTWAVQFMVAVLVAVYLVRTLQGQDPMGPVWELWSYLITILFLPTLALIWARGEASRWSTFVLALAGFVAAVMAARAAQIWQGVGLG